MTSTMWLITKNCWILEKMFGWKTTFGLRFLKFFTSKKLPPIWGIGGCKNFKISNPTEHKINYILFLTIPIQNCSFEISETYFQFFRFWWARLTATVVVFSFPLPNHASSLDYYKVTSLILNEMKWNVKHLSRVDMIWFNNQYSLDGWISVKTVE